MCNLVLGAMPCGVTGPLSTAFYRVDASTLGPSNIPPSSMYGNNTLIRSPKWVLPYGGGMLGTKPFMGGGGCWVPI